MHSQIRFLIASVLLSSSSLTCLTQGVQSADYEGFLPKHITGVTSFLQEHPTFDGRGIKIAVLDSGVDPGAPGLLQTTEGFPKIIDILDATGSGDVDTSTVREPDAEGHIQGLSGRLLSLHPDWIEANPTFHLGMVEGYSIFPDNVIQNYKLHAREQMLETNQVYIEKIRKTLSQQNDASETRINDKEDLLARLELLEEMATSFDAPSPIYDCVVFKKHSVWKVVVDTDADGDLMDEVLLEDYSIQQRFASFGAVTLVNFGVHTYSQGNLLSIIVPSSAHGTHVAGIIGAHYPEVTARDGIAPGAQIVSIKIGDTRLDGMETGIALQRALRMVKDLDCDLINMSYGEPTSTPNQGWFIEQVNELVREDHVVFVASAGNAGPALSTVGAPGGTTSSILAVGAFVHTSMMPLQYGLAHTPQSNLYTWSSRGPTTDGDLGVNFCAPGGAIAPVPTSSGVPAMQMNGTSMASPYACGSIALILSGLQSNRIPYFPYDIRMVLEGTATKMDELDAFSQGHGLIQVDKAFERFQSGENKGSPQGFEIQNLSQSPGRGILLREISDTNKPSTHTLRIQPLFPESAGELVKASFEVWVQLGSSANWVDHPDSVLLHQNGGNLNVLVNPSSLPPGAHTTMIAGRDHQTGRTLFNIPVHVIIPDQVEKAVEGISHHSIRLQPGDVKRLFLQPPTWAKWAEFSIKNEAPNPSGRLALHTIQLLDAQRHNMAEWKKYIPADTLTPYEAHIPVKGNRMMEWAFASYWSNRDPLNLQIEIRFQGLGGIQATYYLPSANIPILANLQGVHQRIQVQPTGNLTATVSSLAPQKATLQPSKDPRDITLDGRQLHHLNLEYQWNNKDSK